jgi:hypothetical protein
MLLNKQFQKYMIYKITLFHNLNQYTIGQLKIIIFVIQTFNMN